MPPALGKNFPVTIHLGLLGALVAGVWFIAAKVSDWENRLERIEARASWNWTARMEADAWEDFERTGKTPNIDAIRQRHTYP